MKKETINAAARTNALIALPEKSWNLFFSFLSAFLQNEKCDPYCKQDEDYCPANIEQRVVRRSWGCSGLWGCCLLLLLLRFLKSYAVVACYDPFCRECFPAAVD